MVRVLAGARCHVRGHGHGVCPLVHRALGRQGARAPQLHQPSAQPDPLQEGAGQESEAPGALDEGCLRRPSRGRGQTVRPGEVLSAFEENDGMPRRIEATRPASRMPAGGQRMNAATAGMLLGGLGLFLLGIHHLTEGLKDLAGDSLRRALQKLVSGRFSAVVSGAIFTAVIQSSTAAILTVIGFVSAGLVTFTQAVGMITGATLGTTSTIWLVAIFGLRFRISAAALPMLGVGAFLWLIARGKTRSFGALLAGFGLIFTGIDFLQTGMG